MTAMASAPKSVGISSAIAFWTGGVSTIPGQIQFTRIPSVLASDCKDNQY